MNDNNQPLYWGNLDKEMKISATLTNSSRARQI